MIDRSSLICAFVWGLQLEAVPRVWGFAKTRVRRTWAAEGDAPTLVVGSDTQIVARVSRLDARKRRTLLWVPANPIPFLSHSRRGEVSALE